jgi:hypothetical protein
LLVGVGKNFLKQKNAQKTRFDRKKTAVTIRNKKGGNKRRKSKMEAKENIIFSNKNQSASNGAILLNGE